MRDRVRIEPLPCFLFVRCRTWLAAVAARRGPGSWPWHLCPVRGAWSDTLQL